LGAAKTRPGLRIKEILDVLDKESGEPFLSTAELRLLSWASAYYLTPIGEVLRHLAPPKIFATKTRPVTKKNESEPPTPHPGKTEMNLPLIPEQQEAFAAILHELKNPEKPILLHGITGSGKTEVYRQAAGRVIAQGGQVLVLVPEIGLTPQLVGRFENLGVPTAAYHSGLTPAQRHKVWQGAREGSLSIVIATRSGVFLKFPNLRLIVVDEEHDSSYKQEERFCYQARDLALWRASEEKIAAVLGSATPSIESLYRAERGKMTHVRLGERPTGASLPTIELIDRRHDREDAHPIFSKPLIAAIEETLKNREQALLFLNRRGLSPFVLCPACGFVPECDRCDISLTLHRGTGEVSAGSGKPLLVCHYCDQTIPYQPVCRACRQGTMQPRGFGTEKVAQELGKMFPNARVARLDRDAMESKEWMKILDRMRRREIDLLIGTQIITKGHDYPYLTLVGILEADLSLHIPDFRASERTFQIVTQVSGRAGRADRPGRVLIQTYRPDHECLAAAARHDGQIFYRSELASRQEANYPPYTRLVEIRLAGPHSSIVQTQTLRLAERLKKHVLSDAGSGSLLGPAPCPIERVRGKTRWHLLIKTPRYTSLQPALRRVLDDFVENHLPSSIRLLVNVDPVDMN